VLANQRLTAHQVDDKGILFEEVIISYLRTPTSSDNQEGDEVHWV
jgi:hypothetical protein